MTAEEKLTMKFEGEKIKMEKGKKKKIASKTG